MNEHDWEFFCCNSPMLVSKDEQPKVRVNPRLQGMISKLNFTYLGKSPRKKDPVSTTKPKAKSLSRPIKKVQPCMPKNMFSNNIMVRQIVTSRTTICKSPHK